MPLRLVKLLVSCSVGCADWASDACKRLFGRPPSTQLVVLYYHGVREGSRQKFALQMDQLASRTVPVDIEGADPLPKGRRYSAVTFDDSFVSMADNALPELRKRAIPCTIFVPTGSLGRKPTWIDPSHKDAAETVTSAEDLRALASQPLVRIGSHSVSHPDFRQLNEGEARDEFSSSKAMLEGIVGREVTSFSFPHGTYARRDLALARSCGYERVFTIDPVQLGDPRSEFAIGRIRVEPDDWPIEFRLKVRGAYRWLAHASAAKRRLSAVVHRGRVPLQKPQKGP